MVLLLFVPGVNGFPILIYLLLWILLPAADTLAKKMEMQGEAIDLRNLGKKASDFFAKGGEGKDFLENLADRVREILIQIMPFIRGITGGFLIFISTAILTGGLVPIGLNLLPNTGADVIQGLRQSWEFWVFLTGIFLVTLALAGFLFSFGLSIIKKKMFLSLFMAVGIFVLFFSGIGLTALAGVSMDQKLEDLEGKHTHLEKVDLDFFDQISLENVQDVKIVQSSQSRLEIEKYSLGSELFSWNVENERLTLKKENLDFEVCVFCWKPGYELTIFSPSLERIGLIDSEIISLNGFNEVEIWEEES